MNSLENKIYVLNEKFDLSIKEEKLDISSLKENEVIGQTVYSCISPGTELAAYQGLPPLRPGKKFPRLVGYCNVGKVLKAGSAVEGIRQGDHILTFSSHCRYFKCKSEEAITRLDEDIDWKMASTVYLFHLGFMAVVEGGAKPGMHVGIMGTGTLGYCTALLCNQFGLNVSVFSNQIYLKKELEDHGIEFSMKDLSKVHFLVNAFDVIINTSNSWQDWFLSMELLRKKGSMVNLGFPGRGMAMPNINPLDSRYFYDKQLTLKTAGYVFEGEAEVYDIQFSLKRNIRFLLKLINKGRLDPQKLISKEVKWDQLKCLYDYLLIRDSRKFTGIINWNENA